MVIIVTGTPGTGKTTLSKLIAKEKEFEYVDLNTFARNNNLVIGFDEERNCDIIDEDKLSDSIENAFKDKKVVIDSHMSHYIDPEIVDICIVTKCDLKELKARLEKRGYKEEKVRENLDSEIFDTCNVEAIEEGYKPIIIWTDKNVDEQLKSIF
ncbi:hypothetical protein C0585_01675 [Candidatus Woesearchaeota archaeon]|nr:MAG: hypothetical protein C0585_01675 [Candidatus Woesearchaeota archaeon]